MEHTPENDPAVILERELTAAVKAARPHLMRAWTAAKALGQCRSFEEWASSAFLSGFGPDVGAEMYQAPHAIPRESIGG
jgi:hypothetical protein